MAEVYGANKIGLFKLSHLLKIGTRPPERCHNSLFLLAFEKYDCLRCTAFAVYLMKVNYITDFFIISGY